MLFFFYICFNLSSVSQSSLSGKFRVHKKVMLLPPPLLLLGLFFLKVKLFLASVSSSRMVMCFLLVSFGIWRSVWFYFLFPVRVCVYARASVWSLPVHISFALVIIFLIFYTFMLLLPVTRLFTSIRSSFLLFPLSVFIAISSTSVMYPPVSQYSTRHQ